MILPKVSFILRFWLNVNQCEFVGLEEQVRTSFQVSCKNLQTDHIDSLVLHSPLANIRDTLAVWKTFEELHEQGLVSYLGLSNTYDLRTLTSVFEAAKVKPKFLQNRFYGESGYDVDIRRYCDANGIIYQSFWTLSANPHVWKR
jgi:hypothetical protein